MVIGYQVKWIKEFFVEKGELFLRVLNSKWENVEREIDSIENVFRDIGIQKNTKILDVGCGNGRIAINLAKRGYTVTGIDISPVFINDAIEKAKAHNVSDRVEFIVGDVRSIDMVLAGKEFDVALMYWTTILGYYLDPEIDVEILKKIIKVVKPGGYLLVLSHASLELVSLRAGLCGLPPYLSDIDEEYVLMEKPELDPSRAVLKNTWVFYRKNGKNLEYVDEISFELRLYSFHEIIDIARKAGWELHKAYQNITCLRPYRPGLSSINIVFKKTQHQ